MLGPVVKHRGIEVGATWPDDCVNFRVERGLGENRWVAERAVEFTLQDRLEINRASQTVIKVQEE